MAHQRDSLVVTTLAQTTHVFAAQGTGAEAGVAFERALYTDLLDAADWRHTAGPDELDMGGLLQSRTGIRYEFDCVLLASDALYVIEAKRHAHITRQHISEFISKLLDMTLGSASEIAALAIKPVFVSALSQIDDAAWRYAISWGIPLITSSRPTPWELLASLGENISQTRAAHRIASDCEIACQHLWRPFNTIIHGNETQPGRFDLDANAVYDAQRVSDIQEFWRECQSSVETFTSARRAL